MRGAEKVIKKEEKLLISNCIGLFLFFNIGDLTYEAAMLKSSPPSASELESSLYP